MPAKKPAEEIFVNPMDSSGSDDDEENDGSGGDSAAPSKSPAASTPSTPRAEDLAAAEVGTDIKKVEIVVRQTFQEFAQTFQEFAHCLHNIAWKSKTVCKERFGLS
jgi:hypothetical protein